MTTDRNRYAPLPVAARTAQWHRLWDRLLRPLPSEVVVDAGDRPNPPDAADGRREKELPR